MACKKIGWDKMIGKGTTHSGTSTRYVFSPMDGFYASSSSSAQYSLHYSITCGMN